MKRMHVSQDPAARVRGDIDAWMTRLEQYDSALPEYQDAMPKTEMIEAAGSECLTDVTSALDLRERQAAINTESLRPPWAPVPGPDVRAVYISMLQVSPRLRNQGVGRYLLNQLQQTMTRNGRGPQHIICTQAFLPLWYMTDSMFGWAHFKEWHKAGDELPARPGTPPWRKFPMVLHEADFTVATLAFYHLLWSTPLEWSKTRARHVMDRDYGAFFSALDAGMLSSRFARGALVERAVPVDDPTAGISSVTLTMAPVGLLLATEPGHTELVEQCQALGNSDVLAALVMLKLHSFVLLPGQTPSLVTNFIALVVDHLVDHCRVMYRPLLIAGDLASALTGPLKTLDQWYKDRILVSAPAPHFRRLASADAWLWEPQRKPHTADYNGNLL